MIDKDPAVTAASTNGHGSSFSTFKASSVEDECDQQHRQRRSVNFSDPVVAPLCSDEVLSSGSESAGAPRTSATPVSSTPSSTGAYRCSTVVTSLAPASSVYPGLSYKQASTASGTGAGKPAGSYRLASLDRLAQRHKLYSSLDSAPAVSPLTLSPASGTGGEEAASTASQQQQQHHTVSMSSASMLYNKREMFFRGENPTAASPAPASAANSVHSAQPAAVPAKDSHSTSHANGRDKENRPETSTGVSRSGSSAASVPPPSSAPSEPAVHAPLPSAPSAGRGVAAVTARLTAAAAASSGGRRARQLDGYVGFANLPNQVYRRAVKRGFHFTMMVVGEAGLGKSTLVNSMFMTELYGSDFPGPSMRVKKTVAVEKTVVQLKETGVNLTLTIVDTPGFGDAVDNSNCWQPVIEYIEQQYESYLNAESRIHRSEPVDTRVHCCLYFIAPSGHNLKPLDVEFMRRLHDKVNIIPVIAKADTMTPEEVVHFKKQVMNEIGQHKIRIYEFPDCEDEDENRAQRLLRDRVPFAVVGANTIVDVDGKKVRGRRYPWGTVQVDNMDHSDFIPLRNMLIRTHMMDMCAVTSNVHYENYRARSLAVNLTGDSKSNRIVNKNPLAQMEEEKREHEQKIKKMEEEMQQVFEMKVKEKKNKLKDTERDINEHERNLLGQLEEQRRLLQLRRAELEKKCSDWQISMEDLRRKDDKEVDGKKKRKGIF